MCWQCIVCVIRQTWEKWTVSMCPKKKTMQDLAGIWAWTFWLPIKHFATQILANKGIIRSKSVWLVKILWSNPSWIVNLFQDPLHFYHGLSELTNQIVLMGVDKSIINLEFKNWVKYSCTLGNTCISTWHSSSIILCKKSWIFVPVTVVCGGYQTTCSLGPR